MRCYDHPQPGNNREDLAGLTCLKYHLKIINNIEINLLPHGSEGSFCGSLLISYQGMVR